VACGLVGQGDNGYADVFLAEGLGEVLVGEIKEFSTGVAGIAVEGD